MTYEQALDDWRILESSGYSCERVVIAYRGLNHVTREHRFTLAVIDPTEGGPMESRLRFFESAEEVRTALSGDLA